ncbi:MAG: PAS domain S-box protein, partial [Erysipelotrichia bacterium]|nr:PAS domain S-box protein [Erysipelotrichia bacterium]
MNIRTCTERETILLVNPSEDDRAELVHILEDDCSILEAASTAEASLILSAPSFSCAAVILDLALPDDGTFELLKLLKQNGAVQSMPVLIASFSRDEDMEEKALKLGAEDFILKPYHAGSVRHRIEGLVSACTAERTKWHSASDEMQKMVDDIPGGIVKFRLAETHIEPVYISESLCRTIGDTREHLMERFQKDYLDGIHPDDRKNTAVLTEEAFRDRKPFNVCYRMQNTHGSCRWLNVRSSMHPDRDGNYDCYAVYSDVTEEMETRQAEEQTAREKELLKDSLPGAVFKYRNNPDWVLTYANDEFFCFFGYTRTEFGDLFGMRLINVLYPGDRDLILSGIISQLEQKDTVYSEIRAVCKNGVIKWVSIYAQHARNEIGKEYFCCTFVDITEKIQAEQKLKNTQTELSTLIHNMPGGVFKYDSITGEFEFISPYMLSMLGYSREEFAKKFNNSFTNMVYIEDRQRVLDEISEQIAVGDTDYCEYRVETGSGELKWVYDAGFLLKQGSKAVFYVVIVDITDRKKAELEIARLQEKMVLAIDHAGLGYWDYDIKNKTAYLNQILTDQYNIPQVLDPYPQEAFDSGTIVKDSYAEYQRLVDAVDRGEPFVIGDIQTINTNGEYKWKRIHFTTLFDEGGKPYWAFATAVTIDDYKLLEQQFSIAAEQTGVDVWIFYIQTRTLTKTALSGKDSNSNKVFENAPFSLIEQGIVHPDDAQEIIDIYRRMADGKSRASGIFRFLDSHTGEYVHFKTDYTLLLDKNGKPDRVICTSIDITEQVHLEQQYQEAMELYQGSSGDNAMLSGYCSITRNKLLGISAHNHTDYM